MPSEWVVRPVNADYGIDQEVEIFSAGRTTGYTFKVQLKGTDDTNVNKLRRQISRGTLNYWRELDVPVLICLYSAPLQRIFAVWAHGPVGTTGRSKTTTVRFTEEDELTVDSWERLQRDVATVRQWKLREVPRPIPIRVIPQEFEPNAQENALNVALRKKLRDLRNIYIVAPTERPQEITIRTATDRLSVSLPAEIGGASYHTPPGYSILGPDVAAGDCLLLISDLLGRLGWINEAARTGVAGASDSTLILNPDTALSLAMLLDHEAQPLPALTVARDLLASDDPETRYCGELLLTPVTHHSSRVAPEEITSVWNSLRALAEVDLAEGRSTDSARTLYNLTHLGKPIHKPATLLEIMNLVSERDPSYDDRGYFHKERAGLMWESNEYSQAVEEYRVSLELGEPAADIEPLLADALLHAGRYQESRELLQTAQASTPNLKALSSIDRSISSAIVTKLGIEEQERRVPTQAESETLANLDSPDKARDVLTSVDALLPTPWITLGKDDDESAFIGCLVSAISYPQYAIWWASATLMGIAYSMPVDSISGVVSSGTFWCGDDYLEQVKALADQGFLDHDADYYMPRILELLSAEDEDHESFTVRLINPGEEEFESAAI